MSYYSHQLFFCCNQKEDERKCCQNANARHLRDYAKRQLKALGIEGKGKVRANISGCLGRCQEGPTLVIYPEAVWYTYITEADIDEIIEEHIRNGRILKRLLMEQA